MESLYSIHGLMFFNGEQILLRDSIVKDLYTFIVKNMRSVNKAWEFMRVESPSLIPKKYLSSNYTREDYYETQGDLCLRPETTPGTFIYAKHLIKKQEIKTPFCLWQYGKSYRKELHSKSYIHMSLDEFYQAEFQFIYSDNTKFDYMPYICEFVKNGLMDIILPYKNDKTSINFDDVIRLIESDRLPKYSKKTMDVEIYNGHKMLEVCSISNRNDFGYNVNGNELNVIEIAFGIDRLMSLLYNKKGG